MIANSIVKGEGAVSKVTSNDMNLNKQAIRFGIGRKLFLSFSIIALMSVAVAIIAWLGFEQFEKSQAELTGKRVPAIVASLKLSEEIARLTSVTPLLKEDISTEERQKLLLLLENSQNNALSSLVFIEAQNLPPQPLARLREGLKKLPDYIANLNAKALLHGQLISRRQELETELATYRDIADKIVQPLLGKLRIDLLSLGAKGQDDNTDILSIFRYQEDILGIKIATNLLAGLLAEGSKLNNPAAIDKVESSFRSAIIKLAVPISKIKTKNADVNQLQKLFQSLMKIGNKGGKMDNIFLLRRAELALQEEMDVILHETRALSLTLSDNANLVVKSVSTSIDDSVMENRETLASSRLLLIIMAIGALVISFLTGWLYVSRGIISRLMILVKSLDSIACGDLDIAVNRNGNDEISLMGKALTILRNSARQAVQDRLVFDEHMQKQEQEAIRNRLQLADNLEKSSSQDIVKLMNAVSVLTNKAAAMDDLSRQASEKTMRVSKAATDMTDDMQEVSGSVGELSGSITEISKQARTGWETADDAVKRAKILNESMDQLQDSSSRISEVIVLINNIASQTNMLALNATIEAERAGEAGRSFSVVASEVKGLANQTENATSEIDQLTRDIHTEITSAVDAAAHISTVISHIKEVTTTIASAVEEQSTATAIIDGTVQKSATECAQMSEWMKDVYDFNQDTGKVVNEVRQISQGVKTESQSLQSKIATFLASVRV